LRFLKQNSTLFNQYYHFEYDKYYPVKWFKAQKAQKFLNTLVFLSDKLCVEEVHGSFRKSEIFFIEYSICNSYVLCHFVRNLAVPIEVLKDI